MKRGHHAAPKATASSKKSSDEPLQPLVRQAANGDGRACGEIYRRYAAFVTRIVRNNLESSHEVEDVVQETFVAAFRSLERLTDATALRPWLKTIAIRSSMRVLRRRYATKEEPYGVTVMEGPVMDVTQAALAQELYWALGELPPELRRPWVSLRIEGWAFGDVAAELALSQSTVKRRIREADARLRRRLSPVRTEASSEQIA